MNGVDNEKNALIDFSGLAKVLPIERIYTDLLSKGFTQIGTMFEDYVKAIRLALPRGQIDAVTQDKFRKMIEDPYFRVPEAHRTLPPAQLIGQVLEGARYEPEGSAIWEMFEQLLERGYDVGRADDVHPAFAGIVRQLAPDEAKLLQQISKSIFVVPYCYDKQGESIPISRSELKAIFKEFNFARADHIHVYLEHFESLGLTGPRIVTWDSVVEQGAHAGSNRGVFEVHISGFGRMFANAVSKKD